MARIKKILENNLVGGNSNTEVYPVTSTRAIYNQEGIQLDEILNNLENSNKKEPVKEQLSFDFEEKKEKPKDILEGIDILNISIPGVTTTALI